MIDAVVTKFGLARMPFGRDLPPSRLHRHRDCGEAAARIAWAVADKTIGMVTGEVGPGKLPRSAPPSPASTPPATRHILGNPATGVGASSRTRSPPSAARPSTAPPPLPSRPRTSWPARPPNAAAPRC